MKKEIVKFVILLLVAIGAGPAGAALWQWSETPASNGNADPTINWAVGMAPSAVDPSARAMMARIAEYRDDISGSLSAGGSATAYTVTTNQSTGGNGICGTGTVPTNGQLIAITPQFTNGAAVTLAADGCTAAPIQSASGVAAPSATLIAGTPYQLKYSTTNTAWMLVNFYGNPFSVPLGGLMPYTGATAPSSAFILPAGQCISNTTYAAYWAMMGSPGSGGCPGGQFAVVDLRGRVLAGLDNLNGTSAGRLTGASYGCGASMTFVGAVCTNGLEYETLTQAQLPFTQLSFTGTSSGQSFIFSLSTSNILAGNGVSFNPVVSGSATSVSTPAGTISAFGGGQPHPITQPTMAVTYLLRVM